MSSYFFHWEVNCRSYTFTRPTSCHQVPFTINDFADQLYAKRSKQRNSTALAMALCLYCIETWVYCCEPDDMINKCDVKHRNTLDCLDQCTCRWWRLSNSRDPEVGKLPPHGYYLFSLMDKPGIELSPYDYCVVSLVDKSGIREIWTVKLHLTLKVKPNCPPKQ